MTKTAQKYLGDQAEAVPRPVFCTIDTWTQLTGMSRRSTYEELARGNLVARKRGTQTLIDCDVGFAWLRSLPPAKIKASKPFPEVAVDAAERAA